MPSTLYLLPNKVDLPEALVGRATAPRMYVWRPLVRNVGVGRFGARPEDRTSIIGILRFIFIRPCNGSQDRCLASPGTKCFRVG